VSQDHWKKDPGGLLPRNCRTMGHTRGHMGKLHHGVILGVTQDSVILKSSYKCPVAVEHPLPVATETNETLKGGWGGRGGGGARYCCHSQATFLLKPPTSRKQPGLQGNKVPGI
jgi:hypothetical protein